MASPQMIWQLSKGFFARNNPAENLIRVAYQFVHNLMTYDSKKKLLRYKFMLAQKQFKTMEQFVASNPYEVRGNRFDKAF